MENVPLISTNENGKIIIERNESISLGDGRLFGGELLLYILGKCRKEVILLTMLRVL